MVFITVLFVESLLLLSSMLNKHGAVVTIDQKAIQTEIDICEWKFDRYLPSVWERIWMNNISYLQNHVCHTFSSVEESRKRLLLVERVLKLQKSRSNYRYLERNGDELFSSMIYRQECQRKASEETIFQFIEPLVGLLRDPLTICPINSIGIPKELKLEIEDALQAKRFLLLGPSAPFNRSNSWMSPLPWLYEKNGQKILFDLGSAFFNGPDEKSPLMSVTSARWFYEYFQRISFSFDRIIAFEKQNLSAELFWKQVPDDLLGRLTLMNVGIEESGKFHPWTILKSMVKREDYVIVKLDIDVSELEQVLMEQVVNDSSLHSLIDEFFFEMHVNVTEMIPFWGNRNRGQLKDAYNLFSKLRQLGLRMHSWP